LLVNYDDEKRKLSIPNDLLLLIFHANMIDNKDNKLWNETLFF
jgi:hypothetical protein